MFFETDGKYRVEAYTPAPFNMSKKTTYELHRGDMVDKVAVDQSAVDGWQTLGEFDFVAGFQNQFIRVNDNTGELESTNTQIVFDALRITKVEPGPDGSGSDGSGSDGDKPPGDEGGCSTSNGGGLALVLFGLVGLVRRRRR